MWAAVALAGCSGLASDGGLGDGSDDSPGTSGETAAGSSRGDDEGAQDTDDDPTSDPAPGDTDGGSTGGEEDLGCDLECSNAGGCIENEEGVPTCECDDGYVSIGLDCLPCTVTTQEFDANVPTADVIVQPLNQRRGTAKLAGGDGKALPAQPDDRRRGSISGKRSPAR